MCLLWKTNHSLLETTLFNKKFFSIKANKTILFSVQCNTSFYPLSRKTSQLVAKNSPPEENYLNTAPSEQKMSSVTVSFILLYGPHSSKDVL